MPIYATHRPDPGTFRATHECERCGIPSTEEEPLRHLRSGDWADKALCKDCRDVERPARIKPEPKRRTHCQRGHAWIPENLIPQGGRGYVCKPCKRAADASYRARKRAAA